MTATVSVVIPCYNLSKFILLAIESVLSQKGSYVKEIIVIDDCSTDSSVDIIESMPLCGTVIKLVKNTTNIGAAESRNLGVNLATGAYIAFLDGDDVWKKDKLSVQIEAMQRLGANVSCGWFDTVDCSGKRIGSFYFKEKLITYRDLLSINNVLTSTLVYCQEKIGKQFFPSIRKRQDLALWLKITKSTDSPIQCIHHPLASYRLSVSESVSSNKIDCLLYRYRVLREFEGFGMFFSLFYTGVNAFRVVIKRLRFRY